MPKVIQYIKFYKRFYYAGLTSSFLLVLLALGTFFPLYKSEQNTEAATGSSQSSSLTLDLTSSSASVDLLVTDPEGSFAVSSSNAEFSITTNNFTGYTLSIMSSNDEGLLTSTNGNSLSSITSAISLDTFAGSTSYNGKWGYRPSVYNAAANTSFLPSPTTTATTLDTTTAPNTSTPNYYTIEIGVRSDYTTVSSSYTNTFIITAVSNPINYTISYDSNTSDNVTNMPATQSSSTSATSIVLADNVPTRAHYTFTGWCNIVPTTTNGVDSCSGDNAASFLPGANYGIDQTTLNNTTLYAMWKIDSFTQTTEVRYENADGTWGSYSTVDTKLVNYGDSYSWDTSSISGFNTTQYQSNNVASYTVTADKTNQVSIARQTYNLTVTAGANTSSPSGTGTYRWGQTVTASVAKATDVTCTSYATPTWTKSSGATGSLNSTSGTSVTYTMGTTNDTITATSTASNVNQTITFYTTGGASSITLNGTTKTNGQTMSLTCGTYNLTGAFNSGYEFSSWSNSGGSIANTGTLSTTYTVNGAGSITLTGKQSLYGLQAFTLAECQAQASDSDVTLTDMRDGNSYTVRYINGNCWMTQNLRLAGGTTITSADSNVASSYTLPADSVAFDSYSTPYVHYSGNTTIGSWYNLCAVSAGINCSETTGNVSYDICPKGWRLPTEYEGEGIVRYSYLFNPLFNGSYLYGQLSGADSLGYWWTSTYGINNYRVGLQYNYFEGLIVYRYFGGVQGLAVRCIRSS